MHFLGPRGRRVSLGPAYRSTFGMPGILARDEEEDEETGETTEIEQDARTKGLRGGLSPTLALQVRLTF